MIETDEEVLIRNTKKLDAIVCEQKSLSKVEITTKGLIQANQNGFDNEVGGVTNKCTGMFDVLASLEQGTEDYKEMHERIICMQGYQQEIIDSCKGIVPKKVPKEWYSWKDTKINRDKDGTVLDTEEQVAIKLKLQRLGSFKKPYFFIYNYKHIKAKYDKYMKDSNSNCLSKYRISLDTLLSMDESLLTESQKQYIMFYNLMKPVSMERSTMNRICWKLEESILKSYDRQCEPFDKDILKTETKYSKANYNAVESLYNEFKQQVFIYLQTVKANTDKDEIKEKRECFVNTFKDRSLETCTNEEELCNIAIDLCYTNTESKSFAWSISGEQIIKNLLARNNNNIQYPIQDKDGDIEWLGNRYTLTSKQIVIKEDEGC